MEIKWKISDVSKNTKKKLYTHCRGRTGTYTCLDRVYAATKTRINVKITYNINPFSDHYQVVVIEQTNKDFERGKGY